MSVDNGTLRAADEAGAPAALDSGLLTRRGFTQPYLYLRLVGVGPCAAVLLFGLIMIFNGMGR